MGVVTEWWETITQFSTPISCLVFLIGVCFKILLVHLGNYQHQKEKLSVFIMHWVLFMFYINQWVLNIVSLFLVDASDGLLKIKLEDMGLEFSWPVEKIKDALPDLGNPLSSQPQSCSHESLKSIASLVEEQNIPEAKIELASGLYAFLWMYTSIHGYAFWVLGFLLHLLVVYLFSVFVSYIFLLDLFTSLYQLQTCYSNCYFYSSTWFRFGFFCIILRVSLSCIACFNKCCKFRFGTQRLVEFQGGQSGIGEQMGVRRRKNNSRETIRNRQHSKHIRYVLNSSHMKIVIFYSPF